MNIQSHSTYTINIDRGGTFTDFYVQQHGKCGQLTNQYVFKEPSVKNSKQGPIQGIRRFLSERTNTSFGKIPTNLIKKINLGTTLATNALLERKGHRNAILLTAGFEDLLVIRNQTRPDIFDLTCAKPQPLYTFSFGVHERVYLHEYPETEKVEVAEMKTVFVQKPLEKDLEGIYEKIKSEGIDSVGVSFANSYIYPENEYLVKSFFEKKGFKNVYLSCENKSLGYLNRAQTTSLEAFLSPFLDNYFSNFTIEFDSPPKLRVMRSDGGFSNNRIKASQALLSGPAGGLIGYSKLLPILHNFPESSSTSSLIGLDMGGTSTDVSKFNGEEFEHIYNFSVNGIEINTPHLQIDTIAAGGGSKLTFRNGLFQVGPQSVGSEPGPVCYGIGDELALTDANIVLNRLALDNFPKVFGKSGKQPVNPALSHTQFQTLCDVINKQLEETKSRKMSKSQIALGFVEMGNQMMARSVRKLFSTGKPQVMVVFGSAGSTHACQIAEKIGIDLVFVHKYSGVLSAFGLSKSEIVEERRRYAGIEISRGTATDQQLYRTLKHKFDKEYEEMDKQIMQTVGDIEEKLSNKCYELGIKYTGTAYTIIVKFTADFLKTFEQKHQRQFGFLIKNKTFTVEFCRLRISFAPEQVIGKNVIYQKQEPKQFLNRYEQVYFKEGNLETGFYDLQKMKNCEVAGPAVLFCKTFSILVVPGWRCRVLDQNALLIRDKTYKKEKQSSQDLQLCDPIKLSIYSSRFMSIAEQMGKALQKTSISTNIKQRLDFSCAIFDSQGNLIANAPHLPVHLGSMQTTVSCQIANGMLDDEVILTNHPCWGGSHLPDMTVIAASKVRGLKFYLAARGHHADIGGISPGSMPAFSKELTEQGAAIGKFGLVNKGNFEEEKLREIMKGSRRLQDNVCDLKAQVAATEIGSRLLCGLVEENGESEVNAYMGFIRDNAEEAVRKMLYQFSVDNKMKQVEVIEEEEFMDDGTKIQLHLTIDRKERSAVFDFNGTGPEVYGNTNAPESITKSAIIYSLRSLIKSQIPLNSGCLHPIKIVIPPHSLLSPSPASAVVGGNVQTSQRLVDLILKPFQQASASQGTMNNFLFGDSTLTYYETIAGGSGAGPGFNGTTCQCHMTNTRITDLEVLQSRYPVCLERFGLRRGSGGKGKWTGGDGVVREFRFFRKMKVSVLSERRVFTPYGLEGGKPGERGVNLVVRKGVVRNLGGKNEADVEKLDKVVIMTPGGGGYGLQTKDIN